MESTSPTPRKRSEAALLAYLRSSADAEGCSEQTKEQLRDATGLSLSTLAVAVNALVSEELVVVERSAGGRSNVYCVTPSDDPPIRPSDSSEGTLRTDPPRPSDSVPVDAPVREPAPAPRPGGSPPLTPSLGESGPPDPAGPTRDAPAREPSDSVPSEIGGSRPIGSLAVAAAMDAARAAGRSIEPGVRARIGNAAQRIAATDVPIETILAAARRMGEAGTTDLATAVAAIEERRAMPASAVERPAPEGSKVASTIRLVRATWPRVVIDGEVWEEKLAPIPERYLLAAVDELAKAGGEFAPHWGQVYKAAWRIGVDDSNRRRDAAERKRLRDLVTAIEEGRA